MQRSIDYGLADPRFLWKDARMRREFGADAGPLHVVLLSGGIDSAAALALTLEGHSPASVLFVDYGQAAAASEARASADIAAHYGVGYERVTCAGRTFGDGEIRGRNALLVHVALITLRTDAGIIVLGIHAGTAYRDCTPAFVDLMQGSYDFHTGGQVSLAAPFLSQVKGDVVNLALRLGVPTDLTYSCEVANQPCGSCLSCRDRKELLART